MSHYFDLESGLWRGECRAQRATNQEFTAFQRTISVAPDIYISPYPKTQDGPWQVSDRGGRMATWSDTSKELFFIASDGWLMRVGVEGVGPAWQASPPDRVLDLRGRFKIQNLEYGQYDVSRDGPH